MTVRANNAPADAPAELDWRTGPDDAARGDGPAAFLFGPASELTLAFSSALPSGGEAEPARVALDDVVVEVAVRFPR